MQRDERVIVMASDERYAMPLATALRSLADTYKGVVPLHVYVLTDGMGDRAKAQVEGSLPTGSLSVHWVPIDLGAFGNCSTLSYISRMTYARFTMPHVIPAHVKRLVYLDCDILVCDDLSPLWETDLQGMPLAAVVDALDAKIKRADPDVDGVPRVQDYFNAGVLVVDLGQWRAEGVSEKAAAYLEQFPNSPYSDQDALNVACDGRWVQLPTRWNHQNHFEDLGGESDERQAVVHFVTGHKPWKPQSLSPYAARYDAVRRRTRFGRRAHERILDGIRTIWSRAKAWRRARRAARLNATAIRCLMRGARPSQ